METFHGVLVWFILTNGGGYIEPQRVAPLDMSCGLDGAVVGVQVDSNVNPGFVTWPDPGIPDKHCRVSIAQRVSQLAPGEYHIATTEVPAVAAFGQADPSVPRIDPHTTGLWQRSTTGILAPARTGAFRVVPPPQ